MVGNMFTLIYLAACLILFFITNAQIAVIKKSKRIKSSQNK